MAKKKDVTEERIEAVESALSKTEQFIETNQKILTYVVVGIIAAIIIYFGYRKFISDPQEKAAQSVIFEAEKYFEKDSLDLALYGDGESYGFLDIIDDYGSTKVGNLANYYAGICFMKKGEYEESIKYLKEFSGDDIIVSGMALGAIGDAYMQLGDINQAVKYYNDAVNKNSNDFVAPAFLLKAGWAYEILGDWENARNTYEKIRKDWPKSREARDIDKYLARAKAHLGEL